MSETAAHNAEPTAEAKAAAYKAPAFIALPAWIQSILAFVVAFLPQILAQAIPAVAAFVAAHVSLAQAQAFAALGDAILALKEKPVTP